MAWTYLADMVEYHSELPFGLDPLPTVKSTDTLKEFYCRGWQQENYLLPQFGTTLELFPPESSKDVSISFMEGSPARISASQEMELVWEESEAAFFSNCAKWSKKSHPDSSFWKTCRPSALGDFEKSSANLQIWGMIVDGRVYLPKKLEPHTSEKDGFSLPTPRADEGGISTNWLEQVKAGTRTPPGLNAMAIHNLWEYGPTTFFPTPTGPAGTNGKRKCPLTGDWVGGQPSLETMARKNLWPTPNTSDRYSANMKPGRDGVPHDIKKKYLRGMVLVQGATPNMGGQLNPVWVEWLMGVPLGHTELEPWVMEWFQPKRRKRSKN